MISLEVYHAGTDPEKLKDFPATVVFSISDKYTLRTFKCKKALEDRSQRILYNSVLTQFQKKDVEAMPLVSLAPSVPSPPSVPV